MALKKILYSTFIVFVLAFNFWSVSVSATPCGSWNVDRTHNVILTRPLEEEIILVMFSEDGGGGGYGNENPVQSDNISTQHDGIDDRLNGEVVDSAANKEELSPIAKSDPLPSSSNETQKVQHQHEHQTYNNTTEAIIEDVGFTTESVKEE